MGIILYRISSDAGAEITGVFFPYNTSHTAQMYSMCVTQLMFTWNILPKFDHHNVPNLVYQLKHLKSQHKH